MCGGRAVGGVWHPYRPLASFSTAADFALKRWRGLVVLLFHGNRFFLLEEPGALGLRPRRFRLACAAFEKDRAFCMRNLHRALYLPVTLYAGPPVENVLGELAWTPCWI